MVQINPEDVLRIPVNDYFDNNFINQKIMEKTQKLMLYASKHKSKECLLLFNTESFRHKTCTNKKDDTVELNKRMIFILNHTKKSYAVIHNHPADSSFSLMDLSVFLNYPNLIMMMVCTNSCKYCAAVLKSSTFDRKKQKEVLKKLIEHMELSGISGHSSALEIMNRMHQRGMISYVEYENY